MTTLPPLRLTLTDLQRLFTAEILPLLSVADTASSNGSSPPINLDERILAGFRGLLAERIRPPAQHLDVPITEEVARRLATIRNITEGARTVVASERFLNHAIVAIFCDKAFKKYFRDAMETEFQQRRLNELLSELSLPGAASYSPPPAQRPVHAVGIQSNGAPASPPRLPPAAPGVDGGSLRPPQSTALPARLQPYFNRSIEYAWAKATHSMTVKELIKILLRYDPPAKARSGLNGLARSDLRFLIIHLVSLATTGELKVPDAALALMKVFAVRMYMQLNAIRSAEQIGRALRDDPALLATLPANEIRRLDNLMARCAVRSGRASEAIGLYRRMTLDHPDDPQALMNYVVAVYSEDLAEALRYSKLVLLNHYAASDEDLIFIGDLLANNNEIEFALAAFYRILQAKPNHCDAHIGLANIALVLGNRSRWEDSMARFLKHHALPGVTFDAETPLTPFALRPAMTGKRVISPLVTIVMTAFNSSATLEAAVESVMAQTASNLELFIVDDVSTDGTRELILALAARDPRIKWIFNERNMGTYPSKNEAIRRASGQYITFHDSDDWMHPERIERHLAAMKQNVMCSTSNWIRMDASGRTIVRRNGPYTHLNPASTFFRKDVFTRLGLFDNVRTGADSEILTRIRHHAGHSAVVELPHVLAIGFHHEASLTQSGATAFDEHRYSPVRLAYTEAWVGWHLATLMNGPTALVLDTPLGVRLFDTPDSILP